MPPTSHVYCSVHAPATTLVVALEYSTAVDVHNVLASRGIVEANADFAAYCDPASLPAETINMINATPGYLESVAQEVSRILNEVAWSDVCAFIDAMQEAGTPQEIGDAAWTLVWAVYENVMGTAKQPADYELGCIIVDIGTPGAGAPPSTPVR